MSSCSFNQVTCINSMLVHCKLASVLAKTSLLAGLFTAGRIGFIKSLQPCPSDTTVLQQLADHWLGCYGLLLPSCFPLLVGVAVHPEAEEASLQVGSGHYGSVVVALHA
jgi:hypothetical protein